MEQELGIPSKRRMGVFSAIAVAVVIGLYIFLIVLLVWGFRTGWLATEWGKLEAEGQAPIIASIITALGLITSAVMLPFIFKDRIASLNDMVTRTERDLTKLNAATSTGLEALTGEFKQELEKVREQAQKKSDESQDLVRALHLAVTTMLGNGVVTDSAHAKHIVEGLWEKIKFALDERVRTNTGIIMRTREELNSISRMSAEHLDALEHRNIISYEDKQMVLKLRTMHYAHSAPDISQFGVITELQEWTDTFVARA